MMKKQSVFLCPAYHLLTLLVQKKTPIAGIPKIKGLATRVHTTFGIYCG